MKVGEKTSKEERIVGRRETDSCRKRKDRKKFTKEEKGGKSCSRRVLTGGSEG